MRTRVATVLLAIVMAVAGCNAASTSTPPPTVTIAPAPVRPAGAQDITTTPKAPNDDCDDREASLRPGPQPSPKAMPPGSTMDRIAARGRLIVGVDQSTYYFGFRDPSSVELKGFDIDLARETARAIFGDPDQIELQVVDASERESALESGRVDLVVRTYSITCDRKKVVDFSTTYFYANQRILVVKGSQISSAADLLGKRVCAVSGTTSLPRLLAVNPSLTVVGVANWTDCLLMLQQGQVDAISTDDAVLAGLVRQDPNVEMVGPSLGIEPYGVGIKKGNDDLVRFVNGVLADLREDGTWQRLYNRWLLTPLGQSPGPPTPRYQD
jgi:polar amino acid transport system substrate-binding protein